MGIKGLNYYLRQQCKKGLQKMYVCELSGKRIAVDTSIYLYKYEADGRLLEKMYRMISMFRYYNIIPLFVFDGKPPAEKKPMMDQRRQQKKDARNQIRQLASDPSTESVVLIDQLKKQSTCIHHSQIAHVKQLMDTMGATYLEAEGEADVLCSQLVLQGDCWACLSEDMDMFVYGCPRVLRYFSLLNRTVICYETNVILSELHLTQAEFRQVCVVCGTDYNKENRSAFTIETTLEAMYQYKGIITPLGLDFYEWVVPDADEVAILRHIDSMFVTPMKLPFPCLEKPTVLTWKPMMKETLKGLMGHSRFFFESDME